MMLAFFVAGERERWLSMLTLIAAPTTVAATNQICELTNIQACAGCESNCSSRKPPVQTAGGIQMTCGYSPAADDANAGLCNGTYSGTALSIDGTRVSGTLPTELGQLTALTNIDVYAYDDKRFISGPSRQAWETLSTWHTFI